VPTFQTAVDGRYHQVVRVDGDRRDVLDDYVNPAHADLHRRVLAAVPDGYFLRRRLNRTSPFDRHNSHFHWQVFGGRVDDPQDLTVEFCEAEASLDELADQIVERVRRHADGAADRIAKAKQQTQPVTTAASAPARTAVEVSPLPYSAGAFGDCARCGDEYVPGELVQDTPAGVICEDCQRQPG
jgi:hypothetical protein